MLCLFLLQRGLNIETSNIENKQPLYSVYSFSFMWLKYYASYETESKCDCVVFIKLHQEIIKKQSWEEITSQPCLCIWTTLMNEPCICLHMTMIIYVLAEATAISIVNIYRHVPSKPLSWPLCQIFWLLAPSPLSLEWELCVMCLSNMIILQSICKKVMLSKIWFYLK